MNVNPFGLAVAVLQFSACVYALFKHDWGMSIVWFCFSVSGLVLALK